MQTLSARGVPPKYVFAHSQKKCKGSLKTAKPLKNFFLMSKISILMKIAILQHAALLSQGI